MPGAGIQRAWANAARTASTPVEANAVGPRPWNRSPRASRLRIAPISGQRPIQIRHRPPHAL